MSRPVTSLMTIKAEQDSDDKKKLLPLTNMRQFEIGGKRYVVVKKTMLKDLPPSLPVLQDNLPASLPVLKDLCPSLPVLQDLPSLEDKGERQDFALPGTTILSLLDFCRVCAEASGNTNMVDIFGTEGTEMKLEGKIHCYLPISVSEGDALPVRICCRCISVLEQSHALAILSLRSNASLASMLEEQKQEGPAEMDYDSDLQECALDFEGMQATEPDSGDDETDPLRNVSPEATPDNEQDLVRMSSLGPITSPTPVIPPRKFPLNCKFCDQTLNTSKLSKKHYLAIHQKFFCEYCFKVFNQCTNLSGHINEKHLYYCNVCNLKLIGYGPYKLKYHISKKHPEICLKLDNIKRAHFCYKCELCEVSVPSRLGIKKHYLNTHEKHACALCLSYFESEIELKNHIQIENHNLHCSICNKNFASRDGLQNHNNLNHKDNVTEIKQTCKICNTDIYSIAYLKRHYITVHKAYLCSKCSEYFYSTVELDSHSLEKHGHKSGFHHVCQICQMIFDDPNKLRHHSIRHDIKVKEKDYLCEDCGKSFNSSHCLSQHKLKVHDNTEKKFKCSLCNRSFCTAREFKSHMIRHSGVKNIKCPHCDKTFYDRAALKSHEYTHSNERNFHCTFCDAKFRTHNHLYSHTKGTHTSKWTYDCNICKLRYNTETEILEHYVNHSIEEKSQMKELQCFTKTSPFQCDICNSYLANKQRLYSHTSKHKTKLKNGNAIKEIKTKIKPKDEIYQCDVCLKILKTKTYFKVHLGVHMDVKPFSCTLCTQSFLTKGSLKHHYRVHTNEKPYSCDLCDKTFHVKTNYMVHHQTVHQKLKKFVCTFCGKGFGRSNHLKVHVRTHTNERPYECKFCGQKFKQDGDMKRHEARHK